MRVVRLAEQPGHTVADALQYLAEYGITLPEDTDEEDFLDRLCVALHALKGGKGQATTQNTQQRPDDEMGVAEHGSVSMSMSLSGKRVYHPPLRPNLPPGVRLAKPVSGAEADGILDGIDVMLGRGRGA